MENKKYNTLVLSGGGSKGIPMMGALQYLYDHEIIQEFDSFYGSSVGGILCVLTILGYTPRQIIIRLIQKNHLSDLPKYNIMNGFQGKGFLNFEKFRIILHDFIENKVHKIPTMKELYDLYGKSLKMIAFNYTLRKEEILCHETHPDLSVLDALRMTSNVPFVFENFHRNNHYYFDGFITSNFPICHCDMETDTIVGIDCIRGNWWEDDNEKEIDSFKIFWNLFILPFYNIQNQRNKVNIKDSTVFRLSLKDLSIFDFEFSNKRLLDVFSVGYTEMKEFYQTKENLE